MLGLPVDEFDIYWHVQAARRETPRTAGPFHAVVSLGPNCLAAGRISRAGLKRRSFPFDAVQNGSDGFAPIEILAKHSPPGLHAVNDCLEAEEPFRGSGEGGEFFFDKSKLEWTAYSTPFGKGVGNLAFAPCPSVHLHDDPFDQGVADAYERRSQRFLGLIGEGCRQGCLPSSFLYRVLFLYVWRITGRPGAWIRQQGTALEAELRRFLAVMAARWPDCDFLLHVAVPCGRHGPCGHGMDGAEADMAAAPEAKRAAIDAMQRLRGVSQRVAVRFLGEPRGMTEVVMKATRMAEDLGEDLGTAGAGGGRGRPGSRARLDYARFGHQEVAMTGDRLVELMALRRGFWGSEKEWADLFASYKFQLGDFNEHFMFPESCLGGRK